MLSYYFGIPGDEGEGMGVKEGYFASIWFLLLLSDIHTSVYSLIVCYSFIRIYAEALIFSLSLSLSFAHCSFSGSFSRTRKCKGLTNSSFSFFFYPLNPSRLSHLYRWIYIRRGFYFPLPFFSGFLFPYIYTCHAKSQLSVWQSRQFFFFSHLLILSFSSYFPLYFTLAVVFFLLLLLLLLFLPITIISTLSFLFFSFFLFFLSFRMTSRTRSVSTRVENHDFPARTIYNYYSIFFFNIYIYILSPEKNNKMYIYIYLYLYSYEDRYIHIPCVYIHIYPWLIRTLYILIYNIKRY